MVVHLDSHLLKVFVLYFIFFLFMFTCTFGLYEDQIGLFDWKKSFVGKIQCVHFDGPVASSKRVLVSSEANVLAALNSRTGQLLWRRVLEKSKNTVDKLLYFSDQLFSLSGDGRFLRSWDVDNGNVIWETVLTSPVLDRDVSLASGLSTVDLAVLTGANTDSIVTIAGNKVVALSTTAGNELWTHEKSSMNIIGLYSTSNILFILGFTEDHKSIIQQLDIENGSVKNEQMFNAPWLLSADSSCIFLHDVIVCVDPPQNSIHVIKLETNTVLVKSILLSELLIDSSIATEMSLSKPHSPFIEALKRKEFILHLSSTHSVLLRLTAESSVSLMKEFATETLFFISVVGNTEVMIMTATLSNEHVIFNSYNLDKMDEIDGMKQEVAFPQHHGKLEKIYAHYFSRKDNTYGFRVLTLFEDHSISLMQQTGRLIWTREESLASITAIEMVELPVSPKQANFEALQREFGYHHDDKILSMFTQRVQAQFQQFQAFVASLNIDREEVGGESDEQRNGEELTRDQFDLRKIIVVVTASGKLYGLNSIDGSIIWQQFLADLAPFNHNNHSRTLLYMQRSVAHFPLVPQCITLGKSRSGKGSVIFMFNPSNGKPVDDTQQTRVNLPYDVVQTMLLPYHDEKFSKILLVVDSSFNAHIFPDSKDAYSIVKSKANSIFMNIVSKTSGELKGYVLNAKSEQMVVREVWNIELSTSEHIIDQIVFRRLGEHVHSPARVLGDRTVLYKYLNPNLMAVFTKSQSVTKPVVNILLIDSVTGNIIYHGRHRNAETPLHVVHSENWIVYKYYNTKARRHELAVLELYEGYTERNSTAFSSLDPPMTPMVLQQSYIFPFNVEYMTTTITNAGITKKHLLIGTSLGYIYALPKQFLDPRRNLTDSPKLREEGLMPYIPELPVITQSFINYNQTIDNIEGIYTSPAGLESTCLVFTYGLDLYFTRVTPSKLFDVLKEDFDYWFISVTLVFLALCTLISSRLASVKVLRQMWH